MSFRPQNAPTGGPHEGRTRCTRDGSISKHSFLFSSFSLDAPWARGTSLSQVLCSEGHWQPGQPKCPQCVGFLALMHKVLCHYSTHLSSQPSLPQMQCFMEMEKEWRRCWLDVLIMFQYRTKGKHKSSLCLWVMSSIKWNSYLHTMGPVCACTQVLVCWGWKPN